MSDFATFVFEQLPPPPLRVLEVGCGREGGLVEQLAERGYDVLGVDPDAPDGERYVRSEFQSLDGQWDAAVAGRMLHHVNPLGESLDKLASLAPLLVVDEFAWNRIDAAAQDWYEGQHRMLRAAGVEPFGPASLDDWRRRNAGRHPGGAPRASSRSGLPPSTTGGDAMPGCTRTASCCASSARGTTSSCSSASRTCTAGSAGRAASRSSRRSSKRERSPRSATAGPARRARRRRALPHRRGSPRRACPRGSSSARPTPPAPA